VLEVFGTTYSASVQDSLYRMGEAALAAVPEISEISMACPNMHFILMNLSAFGLDNNNDVFLPDRRAARPDRMHGGAGVIAPVGWAKAPLRRAHRLFEK